MARYTGPKSKKNRRFGESLFASGDKALERKPYPPGMHGPRGRGKKKQTPFSLGLLEKQKTKFIYGLQEKQFRSIFEKAKLKKGVTGENFLRLLESRLDNIVYLLGIAKTRCAARQFVCHRHIKVNGARVDIPSYVCAAGDVIEVMPSKSARQLATRNLDETQYRTPPAWLTLDADSLKGTFNREPSSEELTSVNINVQLIVEFYSR